MGISLYAQEWRRQKIKGLRLVNGIEQQRPSQELLRTMERTGLVGTKNSVKEELENIRKWHLKHDYKGGLVLRELGRPLFIQQGGRLSQNLKDLAKDPWRLARRECYYLYYEITGTGEIKQQIFCRGTTIAIDVLTCLMFWMVHDEELDCRIHLGFRDQADRILEDLQPLLTPAADERATIEVSGHSLGGAVAMIIAAKLQKRGYRVRRVTSIGAPRFCASPEGASMVLSELPEDNLRIENDTDFVPYLYPFGYHVGNKLMLLNQSGKVAYIPSDSPESSWVDSVLINLFTRFHEMLKERGQPHRIYEHIDHVKSAFSVREENDSVEQ
jgi:hypothetical protein